MDGTSDQSKNNGSALEQALAWYEGFVPLRASALALAPATSGVTAVMDVALLSTLALIRSSRLRSFGDGLVALNLQPTEEEVKTKEFVEAFLATASRVVNTSREEKINLLAKLFASYWKTGAFDSDTFDRYEEDLSIVDELGYKEFMVLLILEEYESKNPMKPGMNVLQRARQFWPEFEKRCGGTLGIPADEIQGYLQRVSRTGLYLPITGAYLNYGGGLGHLTPRFEALKSRLDFSKS